MTSTIDFVRPSQLTGLSSTIIYGPAQGGRLMSHVKWIHNDIKVCNYKPGFSETLLDSYIVHVINREASKKYI